MYKLDRMTVAMCVLSSISITPLIALSETASLNQPYFKAVPADGAPIRENYCGVNFDKTGWLARDFEGGVRGEVGVSYEAKKPLSVTLLFRFSNEEYGKLEILPEEIRLYISPGDKIVRPTSIERRPFNPNVSRCEILRQGEWITLKFPIQSDQAEQAALIFPRGTVSKGDPINIRPFRFERIDYLPDGAPSPARSPISPPALPPVSPRFGFFESPSAMPVNIKGSWIIDAKATEELMVKIPRPPHADKLAQWFGLASGYMALYTYEFDGNMAKASAFRGDKVLEFERTYDQDTETTYTLKGATGPMSQTLSVSMLTSGNIRISPSENTEMSYLRWKPGQLKTESVTLDGVMSASKTWLKSVQAIVDTLKELPIPSTPPVKVPSDSQIALNQAVKNRIIRKATEADKKAFFDAYIENKYTRKNLPVPTNENALAVTNVDISRAFVVLKKFTYPLGMTKENRVVFFIPKDVPLPRGEIGESATYDFATLTVECTFARTGRFSC